MKKVLFITPDFYPNSTGFANACFNLITSIARYGKDKYDIHVFTDIQLGTHKEIVGCHVYRYKSTRRNKISYLLDERSKGRIIKNYVLQNSIDVILFETNTFPYFQNLILSEFRNKCIVRIHSTSDTEVPVFGRKVTIGQNIVNKRIFKFMKSVPYIISTSSYYLNFIRKYYLNENVYNIWENKSYGILHNTSVADEINSKSELSNHFLTMGKLSENGLTQKGMTDLLKAIYYMNIRKMLPLDFRLTLVGHGEKLPYIKNLITKLNLTNLCCIKEQASHDEVFELMSESKAIILLSRYEGQSMFITESISMGKPIIISDNNGMGDMLLEGINGFSVKTGDIEDAALTLKKVFDLDFKTLQNMGAASRKLYDEKFSPQKVYEQFDFLMTLKD